MKKTTDLPPKPVQSPASTKSPKPGQQNTEKQTSNQTREKPQGPRPQPSKTPKPAPDQVVFLVHSAKSQPGYHVEHRVLQANRTYAKAVAFARTEIRHTLDPPNEVNMSTSVHRITIFSTDSRHDWKNRIWIEVMPVSGASVDELESKHTVQLVVEQIHDIEGPDEYGGSIWGQTHRIIEVHRTLQDASMAIVRLQNEVNTNTDSNVHGYVSSEVPLVD
ncbi:MAG: hypothetical protein Q9174_004287 [Haloplaca sp. 1 TL-2023]